MQGLEQLVTAPLEPWDALVCTSRSALQVVQQAMCCMHERLERRFKQTLPQPYGPQLPLIPLGIDPNPSTGTGDSPIAKNKGCRPGNSWGCPPARGWCCS